MKYCVDFDVATKETALCIVDDQRPDRAPKQSRDGAIIGTRTGVQAIPATTASAGIGNWNHSTDRNWEGQIDYLYMFGRVLTDAERRTLQEASCQILAPIRRRALLLVRIPKMAGLPPGAAVGAHVS